jgi:hypothetical protein
MPLYDIGAGASAAIASSNQTTQGQNDATYFNFGGGVITAPTEQNLTPTTDQTPTSSASGQGAADASAPATGVVSGATSNVLPYAAIGIAVVGVVITLFIALRKK